MNDVAQMLTDQFRLTVDCGQSLEAMIAAGRYDWTNDNITVTRFPIEAEGAVPVDARLFHFDRNISSEGVVEAIKTADAIHPWAPAAIEDLLSFGATHPDEQRKYPIVALGSVAKVSGGHVPFLYGSGASRSLYLIWWHGGWDGSYRFLAVRSLSSEA